MEQIIDIGEYGDKVRLEGGRIVIHRADGTRVAVPVGDVAVLMFSEPCLSVSVAVLAELEAMARDVRRGDAENAEGHAALRYWRRLGIFERRDRAADDANRPLNYAYAILCGAVVRALCCAGLNTALGLNHCGPTNPHCLASDLMEPFRPAADSAVHDWLTANPCDYGMSAACRRFLLQALLSSRWRSLHGRLAFFDALARTAVSLRECLLSGRVDLDIPVQVVGNDDVDACAV